MLVLDLPRAHWQAAIEARAAAMFERGFRAEVRGLVVRYGPTIKPLRAVGYRQVLECLVENCSDEEAQSRVVRATRLYGKRQRNWFRTEPSVDMRLDVSAALEPATLARIRAHLGGA